MAEFYCRVLHKSPADIIPVIYLTVNQVAPPYENIEIGIGDGILFKVVEAIAGLNVARIKNELSKTGDLVIIIFCFKYYQKSKKIHKKSFKNK